MNGHCTAMETGEQERFHKGFLCMCPQAGDVRVGRLTFEIVPFGKEGKGTPGRGITRNYGPSQRVQYGWGVKHMWKNEMKLEQ